jgi:hypothetical protein
MNPFVKPDSAKPGNFRKLSTRETEEKTGNQKPYKSKQKRKALSQLKILCNDNLKNENGIKIQIALSIPPFEEAGIKKGAPLKEGPLY